MIKGKVDSPCISGVNDMFGQGCATEVTIEQRTVVSSILNSSFFPSLSKLAFSTLSLRAEDRMLSNIMVTPSRSAASCLSSSCSPV